MSRFTPILSVTFGSCFRIGSCSAELFQRTFLGMEIVSVSFQGSPTAKRVDKFLYTARRFWSEPHLSPQTWLSFLGLMTTVMKFVPFARFK